MNFINTLLQQVFKQASHHVISDLKKTNLNYIMSSLINKTTAGLTVLSKPITINSCSIKVALLSLNLLYLIKCITSI